MDHRHVQGFDPSSAGTPHRPGLAGRLRPRALTATAVLLLAAAGGALADPVADGGESLRRHGSVARLLWVPEGASLRLDGQYLSAGVVLGTRGRIRSALGAVAPALVLDIHHRSNLTLLAAGRRGAMLVWQHRL